jgi:hypothetical protein
MDISSFIKIFTANKQTFEILFKTFSENQITWKQSPEKWCPLEIVCHLYDEECEDFKVRIQQVFESPQLKLPPINPTKWVSERKYMEQDYNSKVYEFLKEREKSIKWLMSLENPPWENAFIHPKFGPMSARYFLTNWLAHDYLHIKQLIRLQYDYLRNQTEIELEYAGTWV